MGRSRAKDLALDAYEHEEISNLSMTELRQRWETTRRIVDEMPPDVTGELGRLRDRQQRLDQLAARQQDIRLKAESRQAEIGLFRRVRDRSEAANLRHVIERSVCTETQLEAEIITLRSEEVRLARAQRSRDEWLLENAPSIRLLDALSRELWWREQQHALAAEVAMPAYLINAVGERPNKPSERAAWHEAVKAIEAYRRRWGISDPDVALVDTNNCIDQQLDRQAAQGSVDNLTQRANEAEVDVRERIIDL